MGARPNAGSSCLSHVPKLRLPGQAGTKHQQRGLQRVAIGATLTQGHRLLHRVRSEWDQAGTGQGALRLHRWRHRSARCGQGQSSIPCRQN